MAKKSSGSSKFAAHLKKAQKAFKEAQKGGFSINKNVEDGKQEAKLQKAELIEVKGGKSLRLLWTWEFDVDKKLKKKDKAAGIVKSSEGVEPDTNFTYLKKTLDVFGYETEDMNLAEDLETILAELTKKKPVCEVTVKTSPDEQYQNVFVNRVLNEDDEDADDEDDDEDSEDEDEDEDDDESEDEEDDEEDEGDDDEDADEPEFEKGQSVMFKPPKARKALKYKITKLAKGKADLKDEAGGVVKGILLEKLSLAEEDEDEDSDDEDSDDENELGEVVKGSKLEVKVGKKAFKAVAVSDPDDRKETIKVKFLSGPNKGTTKTVDQSNCELLD